MAEGLVPLALVDDRQKSIIRLREGTLLVGRSADCGLFLVSEAVSRKHAELTVSAGEVRVRDLGSRNGTFINEKPVQDGLIVVGDRVKFGQTTYVLQHLDGMRDIEEPETIRDRDKAATPPPGPQTDLTDAQRRVFDLLIKAKSEKEVAKELHLSQNTVHSHVQAIYAVFGVHTRAQLIALALKRDTE